MKKLLITLLLLTAPLMDNATLVSRKENSAVQLLTTTLTAPVAVTPQVTTNEEEEEEEEEENNSDASSDTPVTAKTEKQESPVTASKDTRSLAVFNTTGRTITLYGSSADNPGRLLATFKVGDAPAQMITIPKNINTLYVQDPIRSTLLALDEDIKLVIIAIASSVDTFTYTLNSITPKYGEHVTIYNATETPQTVILQTTVITPGIFSSTTTKPRYTFDVPAKTMQVATIPQIALPATQNKEIRCGLTTSTKPLIINSRDEQAVFIITQDNGTPVIHKI